MTFEREERIAFARVVSDLIEADFIVKEKEIETFDKIRSEKDFNITISMLSEAKKKTFAEAVSTLQGMKDEKKKQIIKDKLGEIALSDGSCAPSEALQIMAVNYALDNKGQTLWQILTCLFQQRFRPTIRHITPCQHHPTSST